MNRFLSCAVACIVLAICAGSVSAQTVFSYENGEPGMPYHGNPGTYVVGTSTTTGVTDGAQSKRWEIDSRPVTVNDHAPS